ncbi:MAG: twin-arginine translocase TatA/TatE family subunit [Epsilonproteobacteria bacterium]|nr:twin-arginine translocase TatA/TatE family subunit [Campylobacterota bacterium]
MFHMPGGWELILIVVVILLLFGGKKIPELAKGIGKGIKDFKKAMNEDEEPKKEVKEIEKKSSATASNEIEEKVKEDKA